MRSCPPAAGPSSTSAASRPGVAARGDRAAGRWATRSTTICSRLAEPAVFAVEGGGRRIEVAFEEGYPVAQVYAPPDQDFICFEPMTAPTALASGDGLRHAEPGATFSAAFSIDVS